MSERVKIVLVNGAMIVLICLLLFAAGTWWRMRTQFALGQEAFQRGDFTGAVAGYESAIHMYIPYHPIIEQAAHQLWALGELNERQGDIHRALIAYRALRSSFYAVQWLKTPGREWIDRCDKKIAALAPQLRER
jgi:tetratricopeptide (TPR) repeat protein